jgi:glycosyltransferase involved in cell wall biosynthesis
LSESALSLYFAAGDLIFMAYDPSFTSTSGVLTRAAASGVPVITYKTGLVGWRTEKYKLGLIVKEESDLDEVCDSITKFLNQSNFASRERNLGVSRFVEQNNLNGLNKSIEKAIRLWKNL